MRKQTIKQRHRDRNPLQSRRGPQDSGVQLLLEDWGLRVFQGASFLNVGSFVLNKHRKVYRLVLGKYILVLILILQNQSISRLPPKGEKAQQAFVSNYQALVRAGWVKKLEVHHLNYLTTARPTVCKSIRDLLTPQSLNFWF